MKSIQGQLVNAKKIDKSVLGYFFNLERLCLNETRLDEMLGIEF